eukprot:8922611-Pyramimonas_sp.AAC.1
MPYFLGDVVGKGDLGILMRANVLDGRALPSFDICTSHALLRKLVVALRDAAGYRGNDILCGLTSITMSRQKMTAQGGREFCVAFEPD